jgi:hypothetical protein
MCPSPIVREAGSAGHESHQLALPAALCVVPCMCVTNNRHGGACKPGVLSSQFKLVLYLLLLVCCLRG